MDERLAAYLRANPELMRSYLELRIALLNPCQRAMMEAVPDRLMAEIVNDSRRGVTPPSSLASSDQKPAERGRGSGFSEPAPLRPPPGVEICDRLMDVQDLRDKAALIDAAIKKGLR